MKHLNALEFAESLRLAGYEWSQEICEALEFQNSPELEMLEACAEQLLGLVPEDEHELEPWRMAERISGRLAMLEQVEEILKDAGLGEKDTDDAVQDLINALDL